MGLLIATTVAVTILFSELLIRSLKYHNTPPPSQPFGPLNYVGNRVAEEYFNPSGNNLKLKFFRRAEQSYLFGN